MKAASITLRVWIGAFLKNVDPIIPVSPVEVMTKAICRSRPCCASFHRTVNAVSSWGETNLMQHWINLLLTDMEIVPVEFVSVPSEIHSPGIEEEKGADAVFFGFVKIKVAVNAKSLDHFGVLCSVPAEFGRLVSVKLNVLQLVVGHRGANLPL